MEIEHNLKESCDSRIESRVCVTNRGLGKHNVISFPFSLIYQLFTFRLMLAVLSVNEVNKVYNVWYWFQVDRSWIIGNRRSAMNCKEDDQENNEGGKSHKPQSPSAS